MFIYLIRHGQTDWNIEGKIQGSHNISLNAVGRGQAVRLAGAMSSRHLGAIYSSPQARALETAKKISEGRNIPVIPVHGLREVNFGIWEGMTWEEIRDRYPEEYELWEREPYLVAPPSGETGREAADRCREAAEMILKLSKERGDEEVAVVSHGASLAHLIMALLGGKEAVGIIGNASITLIEHQISSGDTKILSLDDRRHLTN